MLDWEKKSASVLKRQPCNIHSSLLGKPSSTTEKRLGVQTGLWTKKATRCIDGSVDGKGDDGKGDEKEIEDRAKQNVLHAVTEAKSQQQLGLHNIEKCG